MPKRSVVEALRGFDSVLVAVDLTPGSDRLLGRLSLLPVSESAHVTLVHVVPSSLSLAEQRRAARDANKVLAEDAHHLRQHLLRRVKIERLVKVGSTATEIAKCARHARAELIITGRGARRGLRDVFLGSTAERVVRNSKHPVLVVRSRPKVAYYRPALALDLDEAASEVVRVMLLVLPPPRPRIAVIHAFGVPYANLIYPSLPEDDVEEMRAELRSKAAQDLSTLLTAALAKAGVGHEDAPWWQPHVRHGSPRVVVEKFMQKAEPDLLVLGTRGYSGAAYALLGTVAGDLLRAAKCDVLIVPPTPPG